MHHYIQDITACLAADGRPGGVDDALFRSALEATQDALARIRKHYKDQTLPLLRVPERKDDLDASRLAVDTFIRGAQDVVLFGTGGSSLGAQSLAQLAGVPGDGSGRRDGGPRFHFLDNLDPHTLTMLLREVDLKTARFLVISKSGNTPETVVQMICALEALKEEGLDWNLEQHFLALSEPGDETGNAVRRLSAMHGIPVLDHDPDVGGRFAVLSNVGVLPAIMFGLDPAALRAGATEPLAPILAGEAAEHCAPAVGAAIQYAHLREAGVSTSVVMPYSDRLRIFAKWFVQLWAESLGKDGKGFTALAAAGPVDQHSQLQLFLDGPADKFFTIITTGVAGAGTRVASAYAKDPLVGYLADRTVGDLVDCQQRATIEALVRRGRPVRVIHIDALGEQALGALKMHFMLETIIMGHLLGVDPFDQPAVEEGKVLTRDYLSTM